jgi:hypothetical protein
MKLSEICTITGKDLKYGVDVNGKVFVKIDGLEIRDGGFLIGATGRGKTKAAALKDYATELSGGHRVVVDYNNPTEREFELPKTITSR